MASIQRTFEGLKIEFACVWTVGVVLPKRRLTSAKRTDTGESQKYYLQMASIMRDRKRDGETVSMIEFACVPNRASTQQRNTAGEQSSFHGETAT